jgi:TonB family protein
MLSTISMTLFMVAALADYRQSEAEAEKSALKSNYAEAQTQYASTLEAAKLAAGPNHPDVARLASRLALMMEMQGDLAGPEPLYQQAIKILEAPALASPTELATALELYAGLLGKQGKTAEAEKLRERARPIRDRQVREMVAKIPPSAETAPGIKIGTGVQPPVLASRVEPKYAPVAKMAKLQGSVLTMVVIGADGSIRNVEVQRGVGLGLDEQAAEAMLQWKFKPAVKDGQPVAVKANVEINFRLM